MNHATINATSINKEETIMNRLFEELQKELENKGILFEVDPRDDYETSCCLEAVYEWGFTTVTYCIVLDPVMTFYDWEYQAICHIDLDSYTQYTLNAGYLHVKEQKMLGQGYFEFWYNLEKGAPVHMSDEVVIGYYEDDNSKRFYALNDGRYFFKEDGKPIKLIKGDEVDVIDFLDEGYKLIDLKDTKAIQSNIDILNNLLVWENVR
jgi:hypothetical protein